jgi:hypothetical protein
MVDSDLFPEPAGAELLMDGACRFLSCPVSRVLHLISCYTNTPSMTFA